METKKESPKAGEQDGQGTQKDTLKGTKINTDSILPAIQQHIKGLSLESIIKDLPRLLKEPCQIMVDKTEKEVFLIGALGVVSGLLPNVLAFYDGKWIYPNLYVYVLAGYAEGKGALDYARMLGQVVHHYKREEAKEDKARYAKEKLIYSKALSRFKKGEIFEPPSPPTPPRETMLFIPANNSKSGLYQLLEENEGKGIIFESEGDTLADALKQDYGNFSDSLRKIFHHENLQLYRKTEREYTEIKNPQGSTVLSSTVDQLKILIPSIENGLFSRFLWYVLKPNYEFRNVFDERKKAYQEKLADLAIEFNTYYSLLDRLPGPIYFRLPEGLQEKFVEIFQKKKEALIEEQGYSMAGTANRLGIIAFRIMMILATLRKLEREEGDTINIVCEQIDFDNALRIVNKLEEYAIEVMEHLTGQPEKKQLVIELVKTGASYRDIEKTLKVGRGTISKWCKNVNVNSQGNRGNHK